MLLSILRHCKLRTFSISATLRTKGIQIPDALLNIG